MLDPQVKASPRDALRIDGLTKTFTGQRALDDVSWAVPRGSITALLGMNGSGKSTLIKVLAGIYRPDPGALLQIGGTPVAFPLTPGVSHHHGMRFLHQDVGLVESLSIADNFAFVDRFRAPGILGPIDRRAQNEHVAATLRRFGVDHHPKTLVRDLNPTLRTMIGIARAFQDEDQNDASAIARNVLVLDEPTASLPAHEVDAVLTILEDLRDKGGTVIYVSHRTEEVKRIADRLVVLRDGKLVADEPTADLGVDDIVTKVVGERLKKATVRRTASRTGEIVLRAEGLSGPRIKDMDLQLRAGEITGVAGLVGCGKSELMRILAGAQPRSAGTTELKGAVYTPSSPADAIAAGVACVPQDRRREGVVLSMSVAENITLGRLSHLASKRGLSSRRERNTVLSLMDRFDVRPRNAARQVGLLSGGNQQKVVVARTAGFGGAVLLLDEPMQGIDARAKEEIAHTIRRLATDGLAVMLASSDFEDFVGLCDRVLILDRGRLMAEAAEDDITEERLAMLCAQGAGAPK